jgi:methylmalonyl-CoA epimerase
LGIAVASIDKALELYRDALGLHVAHEALVEAEQVRVAMLPAGEPRIELLEPTAPDSPIGRFLETEGEGLHHVAITVDRLDTVIAKLEEAGVRLVSNEIRTGAEGYRYVFVHPKSAGGVLLELIERPSIEADYQTSPSTSS